MPEPAVFLAPKLEGSRFDNHTIPLDMLEDFSALQDIILEMAKKVYLEENPHKKRVPNGFLDNFTLSLSEIKAGSSIGNLVLPALLSASTLVGNDNSTFKYLTTAKDRVIDLISTEGQNEIKKSALYDEKILNHFNRLGKNLKEGESMILAPNAVEKKGILTPSVRRNILLSRFKKIEYSKDIEFYGSVPYIDKSSREFCINKDGSKYTFKLKADIKESVEEAYEEFEKNTYAYFRATGIFDRNDKLIRIDAIHSIDVLDPFDIDLRIHHLKKLEDNWYYGEGKAPNHNLLDRFAMEFGLTYGFDLPLPAIFPTVKGNIELEWSLTKANVNLEIDFEEFKGELFVMYKSGDDEEISLDFDNGGWLQLSDKINELINDRANITT